VDTRAHDDRQADHRPARRAGRGRPRRPAGTRITDRDRAALEFVSEHRLVLAAHVQSLLGASPAVTYARLRALSNAGLLVCDRIFHARPGCYRITGKGLAVIGSELARPAIDLRCYDHDVGVAWLWLAARNGAFGDLRQILSERRLRSHDAGQDGRADPLGVRLGGSGPGGGARLHYPDLMLTDAGGHRIALELELSGKSRTRLEGILAGYAIDAHVDAVVYLADDVKVANKVRAAARKLGISSLVHVQRVSYGAAGRPSSARASERARGSGRSRDRSGQRTR
jgi:hypothetical protein